MANNVYQSQYAKVAIKALNTDSASYALTASYAENGGGGGATPGGLDTQIQFNSGGLALSGSPNFTFDYTASLLYLTGSAFISGAISASYGSNTVGFYGTASWAVSTSIAVSASYAIGRAHA